MKAHLSATCTTTGAALTTLHTYIHTFVDISNLYADDGVAVKRDKLLEIATFTVICAHTSAYADTWHTSSIADVTVRSCVYMCGWRTNAVCSNTILLSHTLAHKLIFRMWSLVRHSLKRRAAQWFAHALHSLWSCHFMSVRHNDRLGCSLPSWHCARSRFHGYSCKLYICKYNIAPNISCFLYCMNIEHI